MAFCRVSARFGVNSRQARLITRTFLNTARCRWTERISRPVKIKGSGKPKYVYEARKACKKGEAVKAPVSHEGGTISSLSAQLAAITGARGIPLWETQWG